MHQSCIISVSLLHHFGIIAVIECNCCHIEVINPKENESFVVAANCFVSQKMIEYNNHDINNWRSDEIYLRLV